MISEKENAVLLIAGFTQREINTQKRKFYNLFRVEPWIMPTLEPAQRKPWVGLTDEEMRDLEKQFNAERVRTSDEEYLIIYPGDYWAWQRAIEAKLREKNA